MTSTPVSPAFKFAWSYGAVNAFEICPLKYYHEKVAKTVPYEKNEKTLWGEDVHEALEKGARDGAPLPSNMVQYQPTLDKVGQLAQISMEVTYEKQFCVDVEGKPTAWFGAQAYGRAAADVFARVTPAFGVVVDYKTGKPPFKGKVGPQPMINAYLAFHHYPDLEQVDTAFVYMQHGQTYNDSFKREDMHIDFQPVGEVIYQIGEALRTQNFPARKGFLCRQYCGVKTCPHNGRYGT